MNLTLKMIPALLLTLIFAGCVSGAKKTSDGQARFNSRSQRALLTSPLSSDQKIMQELTGKALLNVPSEAELKNAPLPVRHFYAGQRAADQKNYIMAIKHYNTVIKKYPNSAQVKPALIAKAKVYKEMGLTEPAQLNMRLAQKKINFKSKLVKNIDRKKLAKTNQQTITK